MKSTVRQIRTLYSVGSLGTRTDAQLLELFLAANGADAEDAFTALVHRHGPMVLAVCRRMLENNHDQEDAFQSAFLVLARRAASIRRRDQLANWLYGVAVRSAQECRRKIVQEQKAPPCHSTVHPLRDSKVPSLTRFAANDPPRSTRLAIFTSTIFHPGATS